MITFIYGTYGTGKTTEVFERIRKDTEKGTHTFLIVPEQDALQSEHRTLERLPASAQLNLEVLSFSRLYNRVCREYGGLSYRYITKPIRHLLMWQVISEAAPFLQAYTELAEKDAASLCDIMLSTLNECKANGITAQQLEEVAKKLPAESFLSKKLLDCSFIFSSFERLVAQNYSDSSDDLSQLYQLLLENRFFKNANVYIDSFTSFTKMEHKIIERIFAQADNVTVTIPLTTPQDTELGTESIRASLASLFVSAKKHEIPHEIILRENHRAMSPSLAYLSENLWKMDAEQVQALSDGSICLEECDSPYSEASAVAAHILKLLRSGERCHDIVVLARNPEQYRGILEPAFEKSDIPYFFSQKTDFCSLPPIKLLLSALRIKHYHWQKSDVISHLKTGLYRFSDRSIDLFEEYVNTWNLRGARFTEGDWTMNPDGFVENISARGEEILTAANDIRRQLTEILERFFILLDGANTVTEQCKAVYRYFEDIDLEAKLLQLAKEEHNRGHRKEAKELSSLYHVILNTLVDIATAMPEEELSSEKFAIVLQLVFSQIEVGTIPTSIDEVTIGSAATFRLSNPKYVFLLGLCEGIFPAAVKDHGLFSLADRKELFSFGVEFSDDPNTDLRASEELMYVRRAFAAPSHGLYLFTCSANSKGEPLASSLPFKRTTALFQNLKTHHYLASDFNYLTGAPRMATTQIRNLKREEDIQALKLALENHLPDVAMLSSATVTNPTCRLNEEHRPGKKLKFSATRFEEYVKCPFKYYCTYELGLRETKQANFRTSMMGTFVHHVVEHLIHFAIDQAENGKFPPDEVVFEKADTIIEEYIDKITPPKEKESQELRHLYRRLKRTALLIVKNVIEEFSNSDFIPAFFELSFDGKEGNPSPLEFEFQDEFRVSFSGKVDRVDIFRQKEDIFVRIIDYKTGSKTFSLEELSHGINLQMLFYLFALCRKPNADFAKKLDIPQNKKPLPAGIVYLSANIPVVEAQGYDTEDAVLKQVEKKLKRTGLLLNNKDILYAMNHDFSPVFLAGIKKTKDKLTKEEMIVGTALTSQEDFDHLYSQMEAVVKKIALTMKDGCADAVPTDCKNYVPCSYCKMKPICRRADS